MHFVVHQLRKLKDDTSGAAIILAALMMPVLVGGMGLGAEVGYRYYNQRLLQHAADFSAHAGAVRRSFNDPKAQIDAAALNVATQSGYDPSLGPVIVVNNPPQAGAFTGDGGAVEVILAETRPRLFSAIYSSDPVVVRARAVARFIAGSSGCILALSGTGPGVTVTGSTNVSLNGCAVAANSTASNAFNMQGMGSALSADCISTVGGASTTTNLTLTGCPAVATGAAPVADPYAAVTEPTLEGTTCTHTKSTRNQGSPGTKTTLTPTLNHGSGLKYMRFCGGLAVQGEVTFAPGLYIIEGDTFTGGGSGNVLIGTDVVFYFTNGGRANFQSGTELKLKARTSDPFKGILFFGSRSAPASLTHSINGSATSDLQGALYFPTSHVEFSGNSAASSGCTQLIANTVTLTGNSTLSANCATAGTEQINVGQSVGIVE